VSIGGQAGASADEGGRQSEPRAGAPESGAGNGETASGGGASGVDTTSDCDPFIPFDTIEARPSWPDLGGGLSFTHDGQTIYIAGPGGDAADPNATTAIYSAKRGAGGDFESFTRLDEIHTATSEWSPFVSDDGLTLYYNTFDPTLNYVELWSARRTQLDANFSNGVPVGGINTAPEYGRASAWLTSNELTMYFVAQEPGVQWDVYVAKRADRNRAFDRPDPVSEINSDDIEFSPTLTRDQLTIYFTSYRADSGAHGGADIWVAHRSSISDPFGQPHNVTELNSAGDEISGWVTPDGCTYYFEAESAEAGTMVVYEASRHPPSTR
jgi:hypothetical protein